MPRFTARRRTPSEWAGVVAFQQGPVAANGDAHVTLFDAVTAGFREPTLVRIRGRVLFDWDISPGALVPQVAKAGAMVYVRQAALTFQAVGNLSDEDILWADIGGLSANRTITAGADSELISDYTVHDVSLEVDTSGMRKLGDNKQVRLAIHNAAASSIALRYSYMFRMLFKSA